MSETKPAAAPMPTVPELMPEAVTPLTSPIDVARQAALLAEQAEEAKRKAEFLAGAASRMEEAPKLNDQAELRIYGATLADRMAEAREASGTGYKTTMERSDIPRGGRIEEIKKNPIFGEKLADREKAAELYAKKIEGYTLAGYELTQAEFLTEAQVTEHYVQKPAFRERLIKGGMTLEQATRRTEDLFATRAAARRQKVRDYAFMTQEQYVESGEAAKDSFDLRQEALVADLLAENNAKKDRLIARYISESRGPDAREKVEKTYKMKADSQLKLIYENGIASREDYDKLLHAKSKGNTAPAPKTVEKAETKELPKVGEPTRTLAPEVDMHDMDDRGLRLAELIAKKNTRPLSPLERTEMERIRADLNGEYTAVATVAEKNPAELDKKAKFLGITRAELIKRLGNFEETQDKLKKKGLPTHEDKLPLTGDKLYDMFSADSPISKVYIGEGGLTPKMYKLLVELSKNKGTAAAFFEIRGGRPRLVAKPSSARRARKIEGLVADINADRQVPTEWAYQEETDGTLKAVGPDPASTESRGAGDILLEQFMGNREVSAETKRRRTARWFGRHILRRSPDGTVTTPAPLPAGVERLDEIKAALEAEAANEAIRNLPPRPPKP